MVKKVLWRVVATFVLVLACVGYYAYSFERLSLEWHTALEDVVLLFVLFLQFFYLSSQNELRRFRGATPPIPSLTAERLGNAIIVAMDEVDTVFPRCLRWLSGAPQPLVRNVFPMLVLLLCLRVSMHPDGVLGVGTELVLWFGAGCVLLHWVFRLELFCWKGRRARNRLVRLVWEMIEGGAMAETLPMLHCPLLLKLVRDSGEVARIAEAGSKVLGASGKALLIDALAKNGLAWAWTGRGHRRQKAVVDLFLSSRGRQLTRLKNCLDMDGSVHNLVSVVAQLSYANRQQVLNHIEVEAAKLVEAGNQHIKVLSDIDDTLYSSGGHFPAGYDKRWKKGRFYPGVFAFYRCFEDRFADSKRAKAMRLLVLPNAADGTVDIQASHNLASTGTLKNEAAADVVTISQEAREWMRVPQSWRRVQVSRPANVSCDVHSLLKHTDASGGSAAPPAVFANSGNCATWPDGPTKAEGSGSSNQPVLLEFQRVRECNLVFLSARPHVHRDVTENTTYKVFWNLVQAQRLQTVPSLLPGSICAGLRGMLCGKCSRSAWKSAGYQKVRCFTQYAELYPEYKFVFVGDNGQADVLAAELMQQHSDQVLGCFMQEVIPIEETLSTLDAPDVAKWKAKGIHFFQSYVGAALSAHAADLISAESLASVARDAVQDYYVEMHERRLAYLANRSKALNLFSDGLLEFLGKDIAAANAVLAKEGLPQVDFPAISNASTAEARKLERIAWQGCDGASSSSEDEGDLEKGLSAARLPSLLRHNTASLGSEAPLVPALEQPPAETQASPRSAAVRRPSSAEATETVPQPQPHAIVPPPEAIGQQDPEIWAAGGGNP
eukprot:CAMPEP_0178376262 /NCGR_PEP_ID=MMETSP0689_2-20121128/3311_1 /TAXON_ID=160604 /ORGANISM="Amphidinium massartii, Strain CS-259" /LENGTH=833 /DNA_ID=CAMNT_0019996277 /DNA_START=50 /DNA_END=2552 /DNA_ORIENTATION=-